MSGGPFDLDAWLKAEAHLAGSRLAETLDQHDDAVALLIVHAAYYAMFDAARAVLLRTAGSAPKKHSSVIGQFGLLVKDRGVEMRQAGDDLNKVEARRIDADYGKFGAISADDARDSLRKAEAFLHLCGREFGFSRQQDTSHG